MNTFTNSTAGALYTSGYTAFGALGDQGSLGNGSVTDLTMTAGWTGTAGINVYGPYAIIAQTRLPSVALVEDSRGQGVGTTANTVPISGNIEPSLATGGIATINLSRASQFASQVATGGAFTKRATYLA